MTAPAAGPRSVALLHDEGGQTMYELLVVVAIVGILSSLAVSGYGHFRNKAKASGLPVLARLLKLEVDSSIDDYDLLHRYGDRSYDLNYLNGRLESAWEDAAGSNVFGHRNPFSGKGTVLNWAAVPLSVDNPAIFITNNERYAFEALPEDEVRPELRGSVVVHLRNNVRRIDLFFFDFSARKSTFRLVSGESR